MTDQTATTPAWHDGDPLMEAIAAAVWEHCHTAGTCVSDDPRNIAAAAAAGIRDAARQATGQPACACGHPRDRHNTACAHCPCVGYAETWPRQTTGPAAACHPASHAGACPYPPNGRCCKVAPSDPTTADDPTPLRWGLNDVLHGDDGTITVCFSGPDREPYWLELDPEQAAALRDDLAGPDGPVIEQPIEACPECISPGACSGSCFAGPPAVGQPAAPAEAHPPQYRWAAELHDPLADEWVPGTRYSDRERAVAHLAHARKIGPKWKDGTPVERRLVRETTTWTVEATP